jgi:hypothetical protein
MPAFPERADATLADLFRTPEKPPTSRHGTRQTADAAIEASFRDNPDVASDGNVGIRVVRIPGAGVNLAAGGRRVGGRTPPLIWLNAGRTT